MSSGYLDDCKYYENIINQAFNLKFYDILTLFSKLKSTLGPSTQNDLKENKEGRKEEMKEIKNTNLLDLCKVFPKGKKESVTELSKD